MNNDKTLGGAPCAAEEVAEAAQEGKKPYVPPQMEVIPLGPQRMLAVSGGVPSVTVTMSPWVFDPYFYLIMPGPIPAGPGGAMMDVCAYEDDRGRRCCYHVDIDPPSGSIRPCDYLGGGGNMLDAWAGLVEAIRSDWDTFTDHVCYKLFEAYPGYGGIDPRAHSPEWYLANPPGFTIEGADRLLEEFLANAQFPDGACDDNVIGTYRSQRFLFRLRE